MCRDYLCDDSPDFSVTSTSADIAFEREKSNREAAVEGRKAQKFSDEYLETLALYRKIADNMVESDCILFHASAIAVDGEAYIFTAKSGTGKSTHTALWRKYLGERAVMINDDKPFIRIQGSAATVYGTPWNGKHRLGCNMSARLKAVCVLTRAQQNSIERIDKRTALPLLIQQTHRPCDPIKTVKALKLADRLADCVGLFRLGCNMDIQAAQIAYNAMK
ncbi:MULTISPECIES: hypothetical protein [unclassified Ruminococcus]|uniref:hypothetical protein n=1 Tax=unclassified Ruminococcus TaxID=2608920 RepID=UPI00210DA12A|nr:MULTISPECIES: hypothetical protein [unclassified Ruminococcus]